MFGRAYISQTLSDESSMRRMAAIDKALNSPATAAAYFEAIHDLPTTLEFANTTTGRTERTLDVGDAYPRCRTDPARREATEELSV